MMAGEPFKKENKPIFPGSYGGEKVLNIFLQFFGFAIFGYFLEHLNYILPAIILNKLAIK